MSENAQNTEALLISHGIKVTVPRLAVYEAMRELGHASADQLIRKVQQNAPAVTVGTIYNVLECFTEHGLIRQIFSRDNKMYFDINTSPHYHLYDQNGMRIEDYNDPELERILGDYFRRKPVEGFTISEIRLKLVGRFEE
ncbi:MAG: transcriptional repressor [Rikenellaceae bacterium]|nr:transcriptional repressor [Rikenellaceae bacterium]